jgi:hypothetical protein
LKTNQVILYNIVQIQDFGYKKNTAEKFCQKEPWIFQTKEKVARFTTRAGAPGCSSGGWRSQGLTASHVAIYTQHCRVTHVTIYTLFCPLLALRLGEYWFLISRYVYNRNSHSLLYYDKDSAL